MKSLALLVLALAGSAHADLYKCPSLTGSSYQETPCALGGQRLTIEKQAPNPRADFERAIRVGHTLIGMTADEATRAWRRPDKVNRTVGDGYVYEQWVFYGQDMTQYLYFTNGILTSVQTPVLK